MDTKRICLLILVMLASAASSEAKKIRGKIFFQDNVREVTLKIPLNAFSKEPLFESLQYRIKYTDASGSKVKLRPDDANEIRFTCNGKDVRMISVKNSLRLGHLPASRNIFLKLEVDGYLKLFSFYYTEDSSMYNSTTGTTDNGYTYSVERFILQKGDEELKRPKELSFRKDMMEYFDDCPLLAQKIEEKVFRRRDLETMVIFYNSRCDK